MPETPHDVLRRIFGHEEFRPGRLQAIEAILAGRDFIAVMPTGAGKSLTYQVPARILPGTGIVISPLIALMKDQVDALARLGFRATFVNSTLSPRERTQRLAAIREGRYDLVYVAPEAIEGSLRGFLAGCRVNLIAVDEAHCISQWGHDFRPSYRKLQGLKREFGDVPVLALTATATNQVARDIIRQLGMTKPAGYKGSFFRPNLVITMAEKSSERLADEKIRAFVTLRRGQPGIVYSRSRDSVDEFAAYLRRSGIRALPYHARKGMEERTAAQDAFARGEIDVIVATIAFGMGIDKANIRYVVHRNMPFSLESYYQEIGRAGRDGLRSDCILFYCEEDLGALEWFIRDLEPGLAQVKREQAEMVYRLATTRRCRHASLVAYFHQQLDRCRAACDICTGTALEALVHEAPPPDSPQRRRAAVRSREAGRETLVGPAAVAVEGTPGPRRRRLPAAPERQQIPAAPCVHPRRRYRIEADEELLCLVCRACGRVIKEHVPRCSAWRKSGSRRCRTPARVALGLATCLTHRDAASGTPVAGRTLPAGSVVRVEQPSTGPVPADDPTLAGYQCLVRAVFKYERSLAASDPPPRKEAPPQGAGAATAPSAPHHRPVPSMPVANAAGCNHGRFAYVVDDDEDHVTRVCRECGDVMRAHLLRCSARTREGRRCLSPAVPGAGTCRGHASEEARAALGLARYGEAWAVSELAHLKSLLDDGVPVNEIARRLGRTEGAIRSRARRLDLLYPAPVRTSILWR